MQCLVCQRPTATGVCIVCCAQSVCKNVDDIFEQNDVPDEDEDYLYMQWLQVRDLTDVFLDDVEASVVPFLYSKCEIEVKFRIVHPEFGPSNMYYERLVKSTDFRLEQLEAEAISIEIAAIAMWRDGLEHFSLSYFSGSEWLELENESHVQQAMQTIAPNHGKPTIRIRMSLLRTPAGDRAVDRTRRDSAEPAADDELKLIERAYEGRSPSYHMHVLRLTHATIRRLHRPQLRVFWQSMLVYGCILKKLEMPVSNTLGHLMELQELHRHYATVQHYLRKVPNPRSGRRRTNRPGILTETLDATRDSLVITLRTLNLAEGGVLMCPRCGKGPIYREQCGDMAGHHGDAYGFHSSDNRCPNPKCRYFGNSSELDWIAWDGFVRIDPSSLFPTVACNSVKDCGYLDRTGFAMGQAPPRPPCFPFKELDGVCIDQFAEIEDEKTRHVALVRTLLGTLKRNRDRDEREPLVREIVASALYHAEGIEYDLNLMKRDDDSFDWESRTDFRDLNARFQSREGDALSWLQEHKEAYDSCLVTSTSDMLYYNADTSTFDSAALDLLNFYYVINDDAQVDADDLRRRFPSLETLSSMPSFPIFAEDLMTAEIRFLEYTKAAIT